MRLPDRLLEGPRRREVARGVTAIPESARNSRQTAPPRRTEICGPLHFGVASAPH